MHVITRPPLVNWESFRALENFPNLEHFLNNKPAIGIRGVTVGVGRLDREKEAEFKPKVQIEKINSLNNFKFTEEHKLTVHRQYKIGPGKVKIA